jgi:protein-ribulosamine 3-kinase
MPLSAEQLSLIGDLLSEVSGSETTILSADQGTGGSYYDPYILRTNRGGHFAKIDLLGRSPDYFELEADGLARLERTRTMRIPKVMLHGVRDGIGYLVMELIDTATATNRFWERAGTGLAALHRHSNAQFGLDRDNYIATLVQSNREHDLWHTFLIEERFGPQLKLARDRKRVEAGLLLRFERLFNRLEQLIPKEPPALLHGDLWHGNILCTTGEEPVLIDPAVHYGHREMDIAMARLFGGFDQAFFDAYRETWPLADGWEERLELHSLYPLLVHGNLFGGTYFEQVDRVLRKFV